ncbi:winged helix-turn-helix transcriptional regulator [Nonomuraea dietziae]|uniref:DNA-binding HxlR family transcriptional regulator n=1 Tax=Nonomuraea dietziae TaxID=65515 RepID=A0A7W5VRA2_9ACTN|nr:helix-turn-helix domain-containing protein [Nonomuraea dietziae]MBB3732977.1 DNA-binding HxlR family transcriptional regulator [Nonomuraea dietziae]
MAAKRRYDDGCGVALAMDVLGERWTMLIIRDLLLGPQRFVDLQAGLPDISPNVLSHRLRELQESGVLQRRTLPPPAASRVYELTDWGAELAPIVSALGLWGSRTPIMPRTGEMRANSLMLSLRSTFSPSDEPDWSANYEIRIGADIFAVRVISGRLTEMARGQAAGPADAAIITDHKTLGLLVNHEEDLETSVGSGRMTLAGDVGAARRFLAAVGL